jgi:hypothetical protein
MKDNLKSLKIGTLPKPLRFAAGKISAGQMFEHQIGRDPKKPKAFADPVPVIGHQRPEEKTSQRQPGHPLAFPGIIGRPLDDEPNDKSFLNGKAPPVHPGMFSKTMAQRGTHKGPDGGSAALQAAGRRGRGAT